MPFINFFQTLWRKIRSSRRVNPRPPEPSSPKALERDYFDVSGCKALSTDWREKWHIGFYSLAHLENVDASEPITEVIVTEKIPVPSLDDCPFQVRRFAKQAIQEKLHVAKFKIAGRGGYGEVLKALSTAEEDQNELYALKIIKARTADTKSLKKWTLASAQELAILKTLDHENIVRFYDYLWLSNHLTTAKCYLVLKMEFLEQDLSDCVSKIGRTESPEVLNRFFQQVGGAVAYMHSQRIVHHDIKASNIMLKFSPDQLEKPMLEQMSSCHYKLIDFGFATRYKGGVDDKVREFENRCGTRFYFCPKKANNTTAYDPYAADAYALGATALYILQGSMLWCKMSGIESLTADEICHALILQNSDNVDLYEDVFALLMEEEMRFSVAEWLEYLEGKLNGVL